MLNYNDYYPNYLTFDPNKWLKDYEKNDNQSTTNTLTTHDYFSQLWPFGGVKEKLQEFVEKDTNFVLTIPLPEKINDNDITINVADEQVIHVEWKYVNGSTSYKCKYEYTLPEDTDSSTLDASIDEKNNLIISIDKKKTHADTSNRILKIKQK